MRCSKRNLQIEAEVWVWVHGHILRRSKEAKMMKKMELYTPEQLTSFRKANELIKSLRMGLEQGCHLKTTELLH